MVLEKVILKVHFCFLYVLLYSIFRNLNWIVDVSDATATVLRYLVIGFFVWFIVANLFLHYRKYNLGWSREDYLSSYVLLSALGIIISLEYLVY